MTTDYCSSNINSFGDEIIPMNWDDVKKFHRKPPEIRLPRTVETIEKYEANMKIIKAKQTISEYLMNKYFSSGNKIVFGKNDYPYFTEPNVYHFLLWIHPSMKVKECMVSQLIDSHMPETLNAKEYIYFENLGNNKSIPDIRHFHVFIRC